MRSAIKARKPPLLEEAVNEMAVLTKKAEHLVFLGYSLPQDDTVYKSLFLSAMAESDRKKITIVNYDESLAQKEKRWYVYEDLPDDLKEKIISFIKVFDLRKNNMRFTFKGFPAILDSGGSKKETIRDLLYGE